MSQRKSGKARVAADLYETPAWVVDVLAEHLDLRGAKVWEPACGSGKMVRALESHGAEVLASDLHDQGFADMFGRFDFVSADKSPIDYFDMIITNCPYGVQGKLAEKFIRRGLDRLAPGGVLALLLQADFDSAGGRRALFSECPLFAGRVVLNRRIVWFEPPKPRPGEKKPSGPSANHTWFLWSRLRIMAPRAPFTLYGPSREVTA